MTATLALVRRDDFLSDVDSLNLLDWSAGWALIDDGWRQAIPAANEQSLIETLTLAVRGATHDALTAAVQALDLKLQQVRYYAENEAELYGVWLRCKMTNETGTRQALVLSAKRSPAPLWIGEIKIPTGGYYYAQRYTLALERSPLWETDSHVVYGALPAINTVGGTFDYATYSGSPGAVAGDVAARVALAALEGYVGSGGPLTKFWCGFRTNRLGNRANFQATWSFHHAIGLDADTTTTADASAKDGSRTTTTFATVPTMLRRAKIRTMDVAGSPADQRGTFIILLRAKLSAAGTVDVRLSSGLSNSPALAALDRVSIEGTSWQFYEMGTVQIPSPGRQISGLWSINQYALAIDAERISGTPQLHLDCFVLIPTTEGWFSADMGPNLTGDGVSNGNTLYVVDRADGQKYSIYLSAGVPFSVSAPRVTGGLPPGAGIVVLAGQRQASSVLADGVNLTLQVYNRWETLRGGA